MTSTEFIPQSAALAQLADAYGIATEFWDWKGVRTVVSDASLIAILAALDVDATSQEGIAAALEALDRRDWLRLLPPVMVTEQGQTKQFNVHVPAGHPASVTIKLEDGGTRGVTQRDNDVPDREIDGMWIGEATFEAPADLPLGYHRLHLTTTSLEGIEQEAESSFIVTPSWVGMPPHLRDRRQWGYATQFYSVRSKDSWGIGDFVDLGDLATWARTQQNAGFLLINPVHAASPVAPLEPSPYLPSSRRYVNPLYIRVETIPEYALLPEKKRQKIAQIKAALKSELAGSEQLDRNASWTAKVKALRVVFAAGLAPARQMAFDDFRKKEGRQLQHFATWCALVAEYGIGWRSWPEGLQRPSSPEVAEFAAHHEKMIRFYMWLQWIADQQLSQAQTAAEDVGMPIGMIKDLAVGISGDGSEAWSLADAFACNVSVGAPPDGFNQQGQDWGQPPWRPDRLAELAYVPFRDMVAGALRHSGGLRVDHIMGMFRLWWVPWGHKPADGAYVRYDHEAMIGILALEAHRAGAVIIGEDLGVVEPWVRDYLRRRGIFGTSVLWFEVDEQGNPLPAEQWRDYCMASVTTHDLPPTAGYLAGDHVRLRSELGLLAVSMDEELTSARLEQRAWIQQLRECGALAKTTPDDDVEGVVQAMHRYLTWTPAKLMLVNLTDAVGERATQNQPGTSDEYPNWRIPLHDETGKEIGLEDVYVCERANRLAAVMNGWA